MKFSFSHGVDKQCYTGGNGHTVSTCMFSWPIKSGTGTSGEAFFSLRETARLNNGNQIACRADRPHWWNERSQFE